MTESNPTTPADSLDDLRARRAQLDAQLSAIALTGDGVASQAYHSLNSEWVALDRVIEQAEADEQAEPAFCEAAAENDHDWHKGGDGVTRCVECLAIADVSPQATPPSEQALAETDVTIDLIGAIARFGTILRIRTEIETKYKQAQAHYLAVQHSNYAPGRSRTMVARDTWREALKLIDAVIAEGTN